MMPGKENSISQIGLRVEESTFSPKTLEAMHVSCKALYLLTKHRAKNLNSFIELVVARLCEACAFTPLVISFQCEQILCELAPMDPTRFLRFVLAYASAPESRGPNVGPFERTDADSSAPAIIPVQYRTSPQVRLAALHSMSAAIKSSTSPLLLPLLSSLVAGVLPSFGSALVDVRKAVVFVLVDIFAVVGDLLFAHLQELTPPQRKLLSIYIQRQSSGNKQQLLWDLRGLRTSHTIVNIIVLSKYHEWMTHDDGLSSNRQHLHMAWERKQLCTDRVNKRKSIKSCVRRFRATWRASCCGRQNCALRLDLPPALRFSWPCSSFWILLFQSARAERSSTSHTRCCWCTAPSWSHCKKFFPAGWWTAVYIEEIFAQSPHSMSWDPARLWMPAALHISNMVATSARREERERAPSAARSISDRLQHQK